MRGRVISVRVLEQAYGVTVGPPPDLYWFLTLRPPRLGELIDFAGEIGQAQPIGRGAAVGRLHAVGNVTFERVPEPYPVREVPLPWKRRAAESMARRLYPYQVDGAAWLAARLAIGFSGLLADDPGLGKTPQAIAAVCATRLFPTLVVCPAALKTQWAREWRHAMSPPEVDILEGRQATDRHGAGVLIANYDLLRHREAELVQSGLRSVILDECHMAKEPLAGRNHRAAVATRICHHVGRSILLTGTPVLNRPAELWRYLHLMDKRAWPSFGAFRDRYCQVSLGDVLPEQEQRVRTCAGEVARVVELAAVTQPYVLRRAKHQVLQDLPPKSRRTLIVRLRDAEWRHYQAAERDVVQWLRSIGKDLRASRAARAQAIVRLTMLRRIAAIGKLVAAVPQYLASWFHRSPPLPLVVFGYHRDVILGVRNVCRRLGVRIAGFGGAETTEHRQAQVDSFQAGWADVFLAPIMAAGYGLNLHRAADALMIERTFSYAQMVQAEDRLHRIGQDHPVTITYLDAEGTVDAHIARIIEDKARLARAAVDGEVDDLVDGVVESVLG